jgi:serine/threonine protein kinase/tetratricopeptide (TPR) repeat protein
MMSPDPRKVQAIFLAAVAADAESDRQAILDSHCGNDTHLRNRVLDLLRTHELPDNALDTPILSGLSTQGGTAGYLSDAPALGPGSIVAGRYRLIELLGEGGMGAVYRAEQVTPLLRTVALKLVKPGMDSKSVLARFASERQALALMDHPNIARVLDAGLVNEGSAGQPFFVMELVDGPPITRYCLREQLTVRQRLELFIPVCDAVQHAHQKGVIHRDLKPGNVLVTTRNGQPTPIIIDFGIAKSIGSQLGDLVYETNPGLLIGSLDYMAPEQAARGTANVDTRADVYSLGAMLYELLCGDVPYDRLRVRQASIFAFAQMIQHEDPEPPSQRVAREPATAQAAGFTDPYRLKSALAGELDWIVMKCLEKDCERRYATASALAEDLRRLLKDEPVQAGPPTHRYRLLKFYHRHRVPVIATGLAAIALMGGVGGLTYGLIHARRAQVDLIAERDAKEKARADEERQRIIAEKQQARADQEAAVARAVLEFTQNDLLRQADTQWQISQQGEVDPNLTVRAALDRSAAAVERRFRNQPAIEAAIRKTIGCAYDGLGEYGRAIAHLTRAAELYEELGGPDDPGRMSCQYYLGLALRRGNRHDEAVPVMERVCQWRRQHLGADHVDTMVAENALSVSYIRTGRLDEADRLLHGLAERQENIQADIHSMLATLNNLALLDSQRGRFDSALRRMEEMDRRWTAAFGANGPQKMELLYNLGQMYQRLGRFEDAVRNLQESRAHVLRVMPPEHPRAGIAAAALADVLWEAGRVEEAGQILNESRQQMASRLPAQNSRVHLTATEWALWAVEHGEPSAAMDASRQVAAMLQSAGAAGVMTRGLALTVVARGHYLQRNLPDAEMAINDALATLADRRPDDWLTADAKGLLGLIQVAAGRWSEAEPHLAESYATLKRLGPRIPFSTRRKIPEFMEALAQCAEALHRPEDAAAWRTERKHFLANHGR